MDILHYLTESNQDLYQECSLLVNSSQSKVEVIKILPWRIALVESGRVIRVADGGCNSPAILV